MIKRVLLSIGTSFAFLAGASAQSPLHIKYVGYYYGGDAIPTIEAAEANLIQVDIGLLAANPSVYESKLDAILTSIRDKGQFAILANMHRFFYGTGSNRCKPLLLVQQNARLIRLQSLLARVGSNHVVAVEAMDEPYHSSNWGDCPGGAKPRLEYVFNGLGRVPMLVDKPRLLVTHWEIVYPERQPLPVGLNWVGVDIYNNNVNIDAATWKLSTRDGLDRINQISVENNYKILLIPQAVDNINNGVGGTRVKLDPKVMQDMAQEYSDYARENNRVIGVMAFGGWEEPFDSMRSVRSKCTESNFGDLGFPSLDACQNWAASLKNARDVYATAAEQISSGGAPHTFKGALAGIQDDGMGRYFVSGWACAFGVQKQIKVDIHFSSDPSSAGLADRIVQHVDADRWADPSVSAACGTSDLGHWFHVDVTPWVKIHQGDRLHVVPKLGLQAGSSNTISGSGLIQVPAHAFTPVDPVGVFDGVLPQGVSGWQVGGWACVKGKQSTINVDIYFKGEGGAYLVKQDVPANGFPDPNVSAECATSGLAHRFYVDIDLDSPVLKGRASEKKILIAAKDGNRSQFLTHSGSPTWPYVVPCGAANEPNRSGSDCLKPR